MKAKEFIPLESGKKFGLTGLIVDDFAYWEHGFPVYSCKTTQGKKVYMTYEELIDLHNFRKKELINAQ